MDSADWPLYSSKQWTTLTDHSTPANNGQSWLTTLQQQTIDNADWPLYSSKQWTTLTTLQQQCPVYSSKQWTAPTDHSTAANSGQRWLTTLQQQTTDNADWPLYCSKQWTMPTDHSTAANNGQRRLTTLQQQTMDNADWPLYSSKQWTMPTDHSTAANNGQRWLTTLQQQEMALDWIHIWNKKWQQHCQAGTTVNTTTPQGNRVTKEYLKEIWRKMWTVGFSYSQKKMEVASQDTGVYVWTNVDYDILKVTRHWLVYHYYENVIIVKINSATATELVTYSSQGVRVSMMS